MHYLAVSVLIRSTVPTPVCSSRAMRRMPFFSASPALMASTCRRCHPRSTGPKQAREGRRLSKHAFIHTGFHRPIGTQGGHLNNLPSERNSMLRKLAFIAAVRRRWHSRWTRWRAAAATEVVNGGWHRRPCGPLEWPRRHIGAGHSHGRYCQSGRWWQRLWRRPLLAIDPCRMDLDLQLNDKRGS